MEKKERTPEGQRSWDEISRDIRRLFGGAGDKEGRTSAPNSPDRESYADEDSDEIHARGADKVGAADEQNTEHEPDNGDKCDDQDAETGGREPGRRDKLVSALPVDCGSCAERRPGCHRGCTERAVREIMRIIGLPERRAARRLREDLFARQSEHYERWMREKGK